MKAMSFCAISLVCVGLSGQAWGDDTMTTPGKSAPGHAKSSARKSDAAKANGLGAVKPDLNPPSGWAKAADFPASPGTLPSEPKGDLSLTYKWRASNAPNDPYDHVRHLTPDGPGDAFMGGLKLGF